MNSELYDNSYRIPENVLKKIRTKLYTSSDGEGVKRAKNLIKNGHCTYQNLKRLKNYFDSFNPNTQSMDEFELSGGKEMRNFVEKTLKSERSRTAKSKEIKRDIGGISNNTSPLRTQNIRIREGEERSPLKRNAVVLIFDNDMRILMVKRSSYENQWMPNKWAFVGGGVEDGEQAIDGAIREVREETGIELDSVKEKFVIQRNADNVEHIFIAKLPTKYNCDDVSLDQESDGYGWFTPNEIKNIDSVPSTMEYLKIAVQNYE